MSKADAHSDSSTSSSVPRDREQALHWYRQAAGITEDVVLDSRAEAEALRRELDEAVRETERLEASLRTSEESLAAARSELDGAREATEKLRRELDEARAAGADAASLSEELERRQSQVAELSGKVEEQSEDVAGRRQAFEDFRERVAAVRSAAAESGAGPSIEIVRPDVLATRGPALVPVPAGVREMLLFGLQDLPPCQNISWSRRRSVSSAWSRHMAEAPGTPLVTKVGLSVGLLCLDFWPNAL